MGKIIYLDDYRRKRCLEALMLDIGMPDYCDECGEDIEALLLAGVLEEMDDDLPAIWQAPAQSPKALPQRRRNAASSRKSRKKE